MRRAPELGAWLLVRSAPGSPGTDLVPPQPPSEPGRHSGPRRDRCPSSFPPEGAGLSPGLSSWVWEGFLRSSTFFPGPGSAEAGGLHSSCGCGGQPGPRLEPHLGPVGEAGLPGSLLGLTWRSRMWGAAFQPFGQAFTCHLGFARCSSWATQWRLEPQEDSSSATTALGMCVARRTPQ